jgi:hypothetical protein
MMRRLQKLACRWGFHSPPFIGVCVDRLSFGGTRHVHCDWCGTRGEWYVEVDTIRWTRFGD